MEIESTARYCAIHLEAVDPRGRQGTLLTTRNAAEQTKSTLRRGQIEGLLERTLACGRSSGSDAAY
jgi:hypothetical protein